MAHTGLTLAAAGAVKKFAESRGAQKLAAAVDYRLVAVGSMLPDIIDKPLGGIILHESLGNGRIYAHTLVFLLLIVAAALLFLYTFRWPGGLVLAGGALFHHVLDGMWLYPGTWLWPLYGWGFPPGEPEVWLQLWLTNLFTDPAVFVPEIAGGLVILYMLGVRLKQTIKTKFI